MSNNNADDGVIVSEAVDRSIYACLFTHWLYSFIGLLLICYIARSLKLMVVYLELGGKANLF